MMDEDRLKSNRDCKVQLKIVEEVEEDWSVLDVATRNTPCGWEQVFDNARDELEEISEDLATDEKTYGRFYPLKKNLFRAFDITPLYKVKVVIVGQDPYHTTSIVNGEPIAQGMSFSANRQDPIPRSLKNIFIELDNSIPEFKMPNHGDLTNWAKQGVLMLNSCLTVRPSAAGSHKSVWVSFIYRIVEAILAENPECIFVLWGRRAQDLNTNLLKGRGVVLESGHPSPFSAKRYGFFGCNHFNQINEILKQQKRRPIDWNLSLP